jgi:hypothetical protein
MERYFRPHNLHSDEKNNTDEIENVPQIIPRPLLSASFPIHHSLITSFYAPQNKLLKPEIRGKNISWVVLQL